MSYEKIAAAANLITSKLLKNTFKDPSTWKSIGTHAAVGGGIGAVGNVAFGDQNKSIASRAIGGGLAGAGVGAGVGAGRRIYKDIGEQANMVKSRAMRQKLREGGFQHNPDVHGKAGLPRTPEQLARSRQDYGFRAKTASLADAAKKLIDSSKNLTHIKRHVDVGFRAGVKKGSDAGMKSASDFLKRNPTGSKFKDSVRDLALGFTGGVGGGVVGGTVGATRGAVTGIKDAIKGRVK